MGLPLVTQAAVGWSWIWKDLKSWAWSRAMTWDCSHETLGFVFTRRKWCFQVKQSLGFFWEGQRRASVSDTSREASHSAEFPG